VESVFYNDNEPYVCEWLRNLIAAGHLPEGEVDGRDIREVSPDDLKGYEEAHFFAGIGGWPYALKLARWEGPVWTASIPCQPLSSAGLRKGHADERHLWPAFYRLVAECRPPIIFGEQVASKDGREWLAGVRADLEDIGYAVGAANLPACSIGAAHERQRLWFVADAYGQAKPVRTLNAEVGTAQAASAYVDQPRLPGRGEAGENGTNAGNLKARHRSSNNPACVISRHDWSHQPVLGSRIHGIPNRVDQVRAYGNAIIPQVAAEFVRAFMEAAPPQSGFRA